MKLKINESLASGFGDSGESIIAILDNLSIDYQTTIDDGRNMVSMKVNYDGNTMMTGQFISDLETGEQWFSIPELNQKALYVSALDTLGDASAYMEMLSKLLESDRIKPIVIRYAELFVDGLTSVEQGTETVTVEGVSQKLTVLKCRLTQEDAKKMVENIFQSMKTDDDIKALILEIATAMNKDGNSLYSDFVDSLQDAIEEIQNQNTSDAGTDELNFEVLLSGKKLAGFRMDVSGTYGRVSGLSGKILIATVKDGDKFGYQMSFGSALELIGSGEDKGKNGVTGEFVLSATGMEALKIELENVVETEGAVSSGIIEISFGKDVLNVMDSEMGSQMGGMSMSLLNPKLKIEMNQDGKKGSGSISVVAMAMKMLEFTVEYEETAPVEIVIPKDYVNASDVDALRQWMEEAGIYDLLASVMGTTGQDDTFYY